MIAVDAFTNAMRLLSLLLFVGLLLWLSFSLRRKPRREPRRFRTMAGGQLPPKHFPPAYRPCAKCEHRP